MVKLHHARYFAVEFPAVIRRKMGASFARESDQQLRELCVITLRFSRQRQYGASVQASSSQDCSVPLKVSTEGRLNTISSR